MHDVAVVSIAEATPHRGAIDQRCDDNSNEVAESPSLEQIRTRSASS